jgi:sugar phosphate isomerase/epimerase
MPITISTGSCHDLKLKGNDAIKFLLDYDIDGIELCFAYQKDLIEFELDGELQQELLKKDFNSIHMPSRDFNYSNNKESIKTLHKADKLAKQINAKYIVFHPSEINDFKILNQLKTQVAIENLHRDDKQYSTFESIKETLDKYSFLKLVFDTDHAFISKNDFDKYLTLKDDIIGIHACSQWIRKRDNKEKSHGFIQEADNKQLELYTPFFKLRKPIMIEADFYPEKKELIGKEIELLKKLSQKSTF